MRSECIIGRGVRIIRVSASGFCVSCSPVRDSLESGGAPDVGASGSAETPNDGRPAVWRAADTQTAGWTHQNTYATAFRYSHLTKRPAFAQATAGKVLAGECTRQGQSTRRGLSSPSMRWITSTTWSVDRATWPSSCSNWKRGYHLRPSRPDLALSSVDSLRQQGT